FPAFAQWTASPSWSASFTRTTASILRSQRQIVHCTGWTAIPLIFGQSPNRSWPRRPRVTTVKKGHTSIASSFCGLRQVPVLPHKSLLFGSQIPSLAQPRSESSRRSPLLDPSLFEWSDANYKTPELDDLAVYELQVAEFNDTFDGVIDRL